MKNNCGRWHLIFTDAADSYGWFPDDLRRLAETYGAIRRLEERCGSLSRPHFQIFISSRHDAISVAFGMPWGHVLLYVNISRLFRTVYKMAGKSGKVPPKRVQEEDSSDGESLASGTSEYIPLPPSPPRGNVTGRRRGRGRGRPKRGSVPSTSRDKRKRQGNLSVILCVLGVAGAGRGCARCKLLCYFFFFISGMIILIFTI